MDGRRGRQAQRSPLRWLALALLCACYSNEPEVRQTMPDPIADVAGQDLYERGIRLARQGDLLRGEQYIEAALERGFPRDRALPALLRICIAGSRYNDALRHAEPYLRQHPDRYQLRTLVASIHLGLGNVEEAQEHLEAVVAGAPNEAPAYYLIGMLHREEHGDPITADPYLRRYLELAPHGVHAAEVRSIVAQRQPIQRIDRVIDGAPPEAETGTEPAPETEVVQ